MKYRLGEPGDAEAIARLHADSWRRTYRGMMSHAYLDGNIVEERTACWRDRFAESNPNRSVIVAQEESQLAGFVCILAGADPKWGALIDNIHVDHAFRRRGIGAGLMCRAAQALRKTADGGSIFLWVLERNEGARKFYQRWNAREEGIEHQSLADGSSCPCYRYVWSTPESLIDSIQNQKEEAGR